MKKVNVLGKYDIAIGERLIERAGMAIKRVCKGKRCCIVSDSNVAPLYAEAVLDSLRQSGFEPSLFVFEQGEKSKNLSTITQMLNFFAQQELTRSDFVVALGGGVVGDLTGFAAAIYLRGIQFVQIPTTLLAQIDSSVGGKTGCDLENGKNLVGAFHHPALVLIDTGVLSTLPDEYMKDGMGELIKYGAIKSPEIFEILEKETCFARLDELIYKCVCIKAEIVEKDFTEQGDRALLNFGHTVGHAIEKIENFCGISHGSAVAIGMCVITRAAERVELCHTGNAARIEALCKKYGLPTEYNASAEEIAKAALNDKKRSGNVLRMVLIRKIGDSYICPVDCNKFDRFLEGSIKSV